MGMPGVLLAFMVPVLIMLFYYPRKVTTSTHLTAGNRKEIFRETGLISCILAVCGAIIYFFHFELSWVALTIAASVYALAFSVLLFSFSHIFRDEAGKLFYLVQLRFTKSKATNL
jgi:membrane-anchored glycerophosphoryl diester phosphodiesterase (GDPDase)